MTDIDDYIFPDWESGGKVHNWKTYINEDLRFIWDDFCKSERYFIAKNAQEIADQEHWD